MNWDFCIKQALQKANVLCIIRLTVKELPLPEHTIPFTYLCFLPDDGLIDRQKHVLGK
jgi:hypothetical protein